MELRPAAFPLALVIVAASVAACSAPPLLGGRPALGAPHGRTLYAEGIRAERVLAHTIYAGEVKAGHVKARVYRTEKLEPHGGYGAIDTTVVSASVIHVQELEAQSIEADTIYAHRIKIGTLEPSPHD